MHHSVLEITDLKEIIYETCRFEFIMLACRIHKSLVDFSLSISPSLLTLASLFFAPEMKVPAGPLLLLKGSPVSGMEHLDFGFQLFNGCHK
jgi:hypothetical protein